MQRKLSHYARKSLVAALAGAAGLVVGIQLETNHASVQPKPESYFLMQAYAGVELIKFATASLPAPADADIDHARECEAGVDTDCTYL